MDLPQLTAILERIHGGVVTCVARDTPEPSPLCHEILNARPYAFLDDAPLEERRAHAVQTRRATDPARGGDMGALDVAAIAQVVADAWPDPRDADELHDALVTAGALTEEEVARDPRWAPWLEALARSGRAARATAAAYGATFWVAAERLPEIAAAFPGLALRPPLEAPSGRAATSWTREGGIVELVRGRVAILGPATAAAFGRPLGLPPDVAEAALVALEAEGVVLRGAFSPAPDGREWCDRRLLARIHRLTLNRLRAEIEPVSAADFMRFLFAWQHVTPEHRVAGPDGLRAVVEQLDGFELAAGAWERHVLPARVQGYTAAALDALCFAGAVVWGRLAPPAGSPRPDASRPARTTRPIRSTPIEMIEDA
jgi:ATP-dependent helicase Lhr and Lhr-like helicase